MTCTGQTAFDYIIDYDEWIECGYFDDEIKARLKGKWNQRAPPPPTPKLTALKVFHLQTTFNVKCLPAFGSLLKIFHFLQHTIWSTLETLWGRFPKKWRRFRSTRSGRDIRQPWPAPPILPPPTHWPPP